MRFDDFYHVTARAECRSSWRDRDLRIVAAGRREGGVGGRKKARRERSKCSSTGEERLVRVLSRGPQKGAVGKRGEPLAT